MEDILYKHGFGFKKKFGQNFLSDTNLLRAIVADANVTDTSTVLEIGTGAGALTRALAQKAKRVVSYEIDKDLKPVLEESLAGLENVEVVFRDFEKENLQKLEEELGEYSVVANLPYYITTPLIMRFAEEAKKCLSLTVMVQEEVALRLAANANTADYGAITAALAQRGETQVLRKVPRNMFTPRPNVDSAVVKVDFTKGGFEVKSAKAYKAAVRCAFLSRRKTLENNLVNAFRLTRETAKEVLRATGIEEGARGETLPPKTLGALSDILFDRGIVKE
ncbi:MAG: ribosomal RNA small subunit methyltransferase A [Clostridia bacterium]|nr:ribosomal RNA small subunit methyltransferase A [Clostridia bacterium]